MPSFPAALDPSTAVTPYRRCRLKTDIPEWATNFNPAYVSRSADQIRRCDDERQGLSSNVEWIPGYAWALEPTLSDFTATVLASATQDALIDLEDFNIPNGMVATWQGTRAPTDLPGVTVSSDVLARSLPIFSRVVPQGRRYDEDLTADAAAFPPPTEADAHVPTGRILSGRVTYPPNSGFGMFLQVPHHPASSADVIARLYWGGDSDTDPDSTQAGEWCLTFRGSGIAVLRERVNSSWKKRLEFPYSASGRALGGMHNIRISPVSNNRIFIRSRQGEGSPQAAGFPGNAAAILSARREPFDLTVYKHGAFAGHSYKRHICGAGPIRMDIRHDLRLLWNLRRMLFPSTGTLVDLPFSISTPRNRSVAMTLVMHTELPPGTEIIGTIFDASTRTALQQDENGNWLSNPGQTAYYLVVDFNTSNRTVTPYFNGFEIETTGERTFVSPTPTYLEVDDVEIEGPTADPSQEMARVIVNDATGAADGLEYATRIPVQIVDTYDQDGRETPLFEGEIAVAHQREKKLTDGRTLNTYDVTLAGKWARLYDAVVATLETFDNDPVAELLEGKAVPYKVALIIRYLLVKAGFPEDQIDIDEDEFPMRLWPAAEDKGNYVLAVGQRFADVITTLAEVYLDAFLLWDPHAGTYGMWRLLPRPTTWGGNILQHFVDGPTAGRKLVHVPGAYAANTTFIRRDSWDKWTQKPEANLVIVRGIAGNNIPGTAAGSLIECIMHNPLSYNRDPSNPTATDRRHPDFLGREIAEIFFDPALQTPEAVRFVCNRIFDNIAFGRERVTFEAPLVFVTDAQDDQQTKPRPLRIGDQVTVRGTNALVVQVKPRIRHSRVEMAVYDCLLTPRGRLSRNARDTQRKYTQEQAAAPSGKRPVYRRVWAGQVVAEGHEAELSALPIASDAVLQSQDDDGNRLFVVGLSALDGDHILA